MKQLQPTHQSIALPRLVIINRLLTIVAVVLTLYIVFTPFLPNVTWWVKTHTPLKNNSLLPPSLAEASPAQPRPEQNLLVIPKLNMQEVIHEGSGIDTLRQGLWRRPAASKPDAGSNTVLVGHRLTYDGPAVLYHLDKVEVGDSITVFWDQQRYDYTVIRKEQLPPSAVHIEQPTDNSQLTIYTCTPLWSAHDRLVVVAQLTKHEL